MHRVEVKLSAFEREEEGTVSGDIEARLTRNLSAFCIFMVKYAAFRKMSPDS